MKWREDMKQNIKRTLKYVIAIITLLIPVIVINYNKSKDLVQNAADRWDSSNSSAHISVFISDKAEITVSNIMEFEESMKNTLLESNALNNKKGNQTWVDCYSAEGSINISRNGANMQVKAIGVGGDFFLFHPLQLVSGSYFTPDNDENDLVVIDEDTAWRLFGSVDIQGMNVEIGKKNYIVSGVIKRDEGKFNKEAGNNKPIVYVPYNVLDSDDKQASITSYEVIMPDLTKNYAYNIVKIGFDSATDNLDIVKISDRYSLLSVIKLLKNYGNRSMKQDDIVYPYWENVSRAREDICVVMFVIEAILLIGYITYFVIKIAKFLKRNSEKIRNCTRIVFAKLKDKLHNKKEIDRPEINTVIFDIGNVLAKFIPMQYLKTLGYDGEERDIIFNTVIENDIWNEYDKGIMTEYEVISKYIERNPESEEAVRKIFSNMNGIVKRFEYTDEWIASLKEKNLNVLYLSNISKTLYEDCREELDFVKATDGGILSFEEKCSKPDLEIYEKLIQRYRLEPDRCIFIDDRQANITAAKNAGINGIYFTTYEETNAEIYKLINDRKLLKKTDAN